MSSPVVIKTHTLSRRSKKNSNPTELYDIRLRNHIRIVTLRLQKQIDTYSNYRNRTIPVGQNNKKRAI